MTERSDKLERIEISIDGDHACALLGPNLQEGEAEFAPIEGWPKATYKQEHAAMSAAYEKLAKRIGKRPPFDFVREHVSPSGDGDAGLKPYQHPGEADFPPAVQEAIRQQMVDFGEIPDRTSPEDFPEGYVLTREEVVGGILKVLRVWGVCRIAPEGERKITAEQIHEVYQEEFYRKGKDRKSLAHSTHAELIKAVIKRLLGVEITEPWRGEPETPPSPQRRNDG